jgi:hypothetical protein
MLSAPEPSAVVMVVVPPLASDETGLLHDQ